MEKNNQKKNAGSNIKTDRQAIMQKKRVYNVYRMLRKKSHKRPVE